MTILNGRIPRLLLAVAYGSKLLIRAGAAASSWKRLSQRSKAKGYGLLIALAIYRDLAEQKRTYAAYKAGRGNLAAYPGTSNHGLGISADLAEPYASRGPKHSWLIEVAAFYGWYCEGLGFGEPWHWTFKGFPARPILRFGSKGDAVTAWQLVLRFDLNLTPEQLAIDGVFGPGTKQRTIAWQRRNKIPADGIVGPKSWKKAGLA